MLCEHAVFRLISSSIFQLAIVTFAISIGVSSSNAQNGGPYIYPSKGQTPEQQNKDRYECSQWAISQSGFDPSKPSAPSSSAQQPRGQAVRGAGRGAAAGAIGGAIAGDAGTGAAAGAAIGTAAAESAAAEQRKSSSNNRQKLKRRLPVVR